ncbi:sugar phosphate isomerase/epimerase family protein [Burkholderia ambifaria]|uniref:sugar phosphate isomerase/epimerase family protein n=1 Tax=Burkholderia ambifaria TaxID=152480 RepID=UPI001B97CC35|nr:sugar phosphate isomerase/epimerase family protein [Burkholderia ambifaria]MBR8257582.1 sugar phosphate isomerase/epimerase [Burkholderia ambifaria]
MTATPAVANACRTPGVNTYGYIWQEPVVKCIGRLAAHGFRSFEPVINPPHLPLDGPSPDDCTLLRRMVDEGQIEMTSLNLPSLDVNLASPLVEMRRYSLTICRRAIDLADRLGIPRLIVVPGRLNPLLAPPVEQLHDWLAASLAELIPYAAERNVGLALENVPFAALPRASDLVGFVDAMNSPVLSVCYDVANAHFIGEAPHDGIASLGARISVVHMSDTGSHRWAHEEIGHGTVPFGMLASSLDAVGYRGPCLLEIIADDARPAIIRSAAALAALGAWNVPGGLHPERF